MAETKTKSTINEVPVIEQEKNVTIRIPKEKKDQEDVVVWVNEKRYLIKRGTPVNVPESVALVLENQERMLQYSYEFEEKSQTE